MSDAPTQIQPAPKGGAPAKQPITIGAHPRATRSVRRMRALGGLAGFAVALLLSLQAGVPAWDAVARGLIAGVALHLAAWAVAVAVWRQLMLAELHALHDRRRAPSR